MGARVHPLCGRGRLRRWVERYEDHNDYLWDAREDAVADAAKWYLESRKSA